MCSKLQLHYEHTLLTGSKALRLGFRPGSTMTSSAKKTGSTLGSMNDLASALWSSVTISDSSSASAGLISNGNAKSSTKGGSSERGGGILRRLRSRCSRVKDRLERRDKRALKVFAVSVRPETLAGDVLVNWLLLRGLALRHLGRVWEAVLMFKLLLMLQESAPRTRYASFIALFHIADILLTFDISEQRKPQRVSFVVSI
jgi:hypothetical protein